MPILERERKKIYFEFFFVTIVLFFKRKVFAKLQKMIFKVPVIKKIENIAARLNARVWGQKLTIFQNLTPKIYIPDRQKFVGFQKSKKKS